MTSINESFRHSSEKSGLARRWMSFGEAAYLVMVVAALIVFGVALASVSAVERNWAKTHGRE